VAQQDTDAIISIGSRSWRFPVPEIGLDSEFEWRGGDGKLYLHDGVGNVVEGTEVDNPEVVAVVPLPSAAERRRREVMLARVMLVAIDIILAGDPLGLESARDLVREVKHTFPELLADWDEL